MSVRVIINEPNALMRGVLRDTLEEDGLRVVGECATAEQALEVAARVEADVLTTNVLMSGSTDGYGLTARLHIDQPDLPVLVLTAFDGDQHVERARAAGARGFLKKSSDRATVTAALTHIAAGGTWFGDEPVAPR
ncbi:MAG TPA: response regulator transcription factor [Gaiellales bacterium]|jgi:DNA-binding NarL/FixJ family response regulator